MQTLKQQALLNRSVSNTAVMFSRNNEQQLTGDEAKKIARIWIDGEIIGGYLVYSALDVKSYAKEPVRSTSGVIENLNAYTTFLTPTVTIEFKYMPINTYRTIIRLIQARNEHVVKYYDIVADKFVTRKMYFKPEQMPELFSKRYEVLAVLNYKLELVGTNSNLDLIQIMYHPNPPVEVTTNMGSLGSIDSYLNGEEVVIGEDANAKQVIENSDIIDAGYKFTYWTSNADGTGAKFINGQVYTINDTYSEEETKLENELLVTNKVINLYAQWNSTNEYTLSYNYGIGAIATDSEGQQIISKTVVYNESTYGALPNAVAPDVIFNGTSYAGANVYTTKGWYKTPTIGANQSAINPTDKYNIKGNTTIYLIFEPNEFSITFNTNGADAPQDGYSQIKNKYGTMIYAPQNPTKDGYTFNGWWIQGSGETEDKDVQFMFGTMPPTNITVYAKWIEKED